MYHRYVNYHKLNNLIWVYNAPREGWYPGDDVVDINSIDCYVDIGNHESLSEKYIEANKITNGEKLLALGENGPIPDPDKIIESNTPWLWFMTWNNFVKEIQWNSDEELKKFYNNPYVINLENLPKLDSQITVRGEIMRSETNALELALHLYKLGELIKDMDDKINNEKDEELKRIYINEREDMYSNQIEIIHKLRSLDI